MKVFKLPDLGEGLPDAEIVEWHVKVGDEIVADQPLVSVETAKAVVEIPSPYSGRITRLFGNPGEIVRLGAPLAVFDGAGDAADAGAVVGAVQVGQESMSPRLPRAWVARPRRSRRRLPCAPWLANSTSNSRW